MAFFSESVRKTSKRLWVEFLLCTWVSGTVKVPPNQILSNVALATFTGAWRWGVCLFYDLRAARPLPDTIFLNTFLTSF